MDRLRCFTMRDSLIGSGVKFDNKLLNDDWRIICEKGHEIGPKLSKIKFQFFSIFFSKGNERNSAIFKKIADLRLIEDQWRAIGSQTSRKAWLAASSNECSLRCLQGLRAIELGKKKVNFSNLFINLGSRSDTTTSNDGGIFFRGKSWGLLAYWSENEKVSGNTTFYYYIVYLLLGQTYCLWRVERRERLTDRRKISVGGLSGPLSSWI